MPASPRSGPALLLALVALGGCTTRQAALPLPSPPWPAMDAAPTRASIVQPEPGRPTEAWRAAVVPRSRWAQGQPEPSRMDPMLPPASITIHHDGMQPFQGTDPSAVAAHLELIRQMHRGKGWGDIGYHFAIDRAGRIWETRPLAYQGAHVKDHNEGNIGIVVLGNFEQQMPTDAQVEALRACLATLMQCYGIPARRVYTHREWPGAATACPGGRLQRVVEELR